MLLAVALFTLVTIIPSRSDNNACKDARHWEMVNIPVDHTDKGTEVVHGTIYMMRDRALGQLMQLRNGELFYLDRNLWEQYDAQSLRDSMRILRFLKIPLRSRLAPGTVYPVTEKPHHIPEAVHTVRCY